MKMAKTCSKLSIQSEHVQCYSCKELFHGICSGAKKDELLATKTMISNFLLSSTRNNFVFFCDCCVTKLEISTAESDKQRINLLETKMSTIDNQLKEITTMLKSKAENPVPPKQIQKPLPQPKYSFWSDSVKLATVKAPSPKAVLVISKSPDERVNAENQIVVEKTAVDSQIPLRETYTTKAGDRVLVCKSKEERDKLKDLVHTTNEDILMNSPEAPIHNYCGVG